MGLKPPELTSSALSVRSSFVVLQSFSTNNLTAEIPSGMLKSSKFSESAPDLTAAAKSAILPDTHVRHQITVTQESDEGKLTILTGEQPNHMLSNVIRSPTVEAAQTLSESVARLEKGFHSHGQLIQSRETESETDRNGQLFNGGQNEDRRRARTLGAPFTLNTALTGDRNELPSPIGTKSPQLAPGGEEVPGAIIRSLMRLDIGGDNSKSKTSFKSNNAVFCN